MLVGKKHAWYGRSESKASVITDAWGECARRQMRRVSAATIGFLRLGRAVDSTVAVQRKGETYSGTPCTDIHGTYADRYLLLLCFALCASRGDQKHETCRDVCTPGMFSLIFFVFHETDVRCISGSYLRHRFVLLAAHKVQKSRP